MKIIITADPEDAMDVLQLILKQRATFDSRPERLGWGWSFSIPNGKRFFLAQIKGGISARPALLREERRQITASRKEQGAG